MRKEKLSLVVSPILSNLMCKKRSKSLFYYLVTKITFDYELTLGFQ